ncbi:hypothetical protein CRUP_019461 [Coryphaenoides rupestris]|nr:hypothetical protein CRUP_019461 [Coryphaenoides rupestris]
MAARWSSENVVVEFRDAQATAMSVDCLGHHAVLSGRRFLYIVNLESPSEPPPKIGRQSKWDVGTVQWNPHKSQSCVFAASSNQRVDLYTWKDGCGDVHASLQGHTRVISDLDWSWFEPEYLVSSSVDTYIYIWDTRDTRKPMVALSAVAGASQVKWNKRNQHLLASSHDGDVRIWDRRKPNTAVEYVAAHLSKIHGLDWHPDNEFILATSSQDNSVKFWDYRQPRKCLNILSCQVPVWKARYTPFSHGLVTVMVPQLRRENSLLLWSTLELNSPVHAFVGHDDVVLEFQWRPQKEGSKDCQLVTWSRDQTLRIWRVDPQLQRLCANDMVEDLLEGMSFSMEPERSLASQDPEPLHTAGLSADHLTDPDGEQSALGSSGRHEPGSSGLPQTLQQEFSLVNLQIRNVNVEFVSPTTIPSAMKTKIQKILTDTSLQKVKRNQNCLEPCVRQLMSCLESDMTQEDGPATSPYVLSNPDANIPFPRTSGARFCGTGCLVYFTRPITMHRSVPPTEPTPRSLSALSAYHSGVLTPMKMRTESQSTLRLYSGSPTRSDKDTVSISSFYYKERKSRRFKTKREGSDYSSRPIKLAGKVIIQEISCLLPVHKALGESYILNVSDIQDTCQKNAAAALAVGRRDVAKVWALASAATSQDLSPDLDPDTDTPWARHPFGRPLLETLLDHYSQMSDVQTLAMLCSVFRAQGPAPRTRALCMASTRLAPPSSPTTTHDTFTSSSVGSGSCSSTSDSAGTRSTSPPGKELYDRYGEQGLREGGGGGAGMDDIFSHIFGGGLFGFMGGQGGRARNGGRRRGEDMVHPLKLLDPANTLQFDDFKKCYGEILHRWGLKEKRAEVLKFASCPPEPHRGIEFGVYCCHCRSQARGTQGNNIVQVPLNHLP